VRALTEELNRLAGLLGTANQAAPPLFVADSGIQTHIEALQQRVSGGTAAHEPEDNVRQAVRRFWLDSRLENIKDGRLVCFGLVLRPTDGGRCILEDKNRFLAVLDASTGVDQWLDQPRWYRRCYQGLVRSYFTYDPYKIETSAQARDNWGHLRDYLKDRIKSISDSGANPDWVQAAIENENLFSEDPCGRYAPEVLAGETEHLDRMRSLLGILDASWFLRELLLSQVKKATDLSQSDFDSRLATLLQALDPHELVRGKGLRLLLNKYVSRASPVEHPSLRDYAVAWWGNPWLPSNETTWGGVDPAARQMVSDWLKGELIDAFFTKLAADGRADRQRVNFWMRYVKLIDHVQFALGSIARNSRDADMLVLRQKMSGLISELDGQGGSVNAFVMVMGDVVAVEFGSDGNALYVYRRGNLPFDTAEPLRLPVNATNSLKNSSAVLTLSHQDNIRGYSRWEDRFDAALKSNFNLALRPNRAHAGAIGPEGLSAQPPTVLSPPSLQPRVSDLGAAASRAAQAENERNAAQFFQSLYPAGLAGPGTSSAKTEWSMCTMTLLTDARLKDVCGKTGIRIEDHRPEGNLWVRADDSETVRSQALTQWGFTFKSGKGWWRK